MSAPAPRWSAGPRVRLDSLTVGDRFLAYDGAAYTVIGWYLDRIGGCPRVVGDDGAVTMFAGCAEGVILPHRERRAV
jgi:hypothetical protein